MRLVQVGEHHVKECAWAQKLFRYERLWLPLLAAKSESPVSDASFWPPLDVRLMMHAHALDPAAYAADCRTVADRVFSQSVGPPSDGAGEARARVAWSEMYGKAPFKLDAGFVEAMLETGLVQGKVCTAAFELRRSLNQINFTLNFDANDVTPRILSFSQSEKFTFFCRRLLLSLLGGSRLFGLEDRRPFPLRCVQAALQREGLLERSRGQIRQVYRRLSSTLTIDWFLDSGFCSFRRVTATSPRRPLCQRTSIWSGGPTSRTPCNIQWPC